MKKLILPLACLLCASSAYAMPEKKAPLIRPPHEAKAMPPAKAQVDRFAQIDANKNGVIDWPELSAARPNLTRGAFDSIDKNKDGGINRHEWDSFSKGHTGNSGMPPQMMDAMRDRANKAPAMPPHEMEGKRPMIMPPAPK